jgi:predicted dehydrogenase
MIGCGYVADFYTKSLTNHANLELAGVFDRDAARSRRFTEYYGVKSYDSLADVMSDSTIELIVNLTNPRSHYIVSKAALDAGKHVYSEKPLSLCLEEAEELVNLAEERGLLLASAPCNLLSETAQTAWKALREGRIGTPRLAYAELDEELFFSNYTEWKTESGAPWPFDDEFETGCTLEHAGYYLGWLTAFFGPAKRVVSFSHTLLPDKGPNGDSGAPDFSVGTIEFESGIVARMTNSIYATKDHTLRIFGDEGTLTIPECWDYGAPVYLDHHIRKSWREKHPRRARILGMERRSLPPVRPAKFEHCGFGHKMDLSRGISELADAITEKRQPRLSAKWSLHVNELALAISGGGQHELRTTFEPIAPMPWSL